MAQTEVLLLHPIANLGHEGEQVRVKAGYARNYLVPRKLAVPHTRANQRQIEALQKRRDERQAKELETAREQMQKIEAVRLSIVVKTGEGGKMFGSVTANDLLDKLKEEGVEIDRKQLHLPAPVKTLGDHTVEVKLHPEVEGELKFEVLSENPIED